MNTALAPSRSGVFSTRDSLPWPQPSPPFAPRLRRRQMRAATTAAACPRKSGGQFRHYKAADDFPIQGAVGDPQAFREEIFGEHFTITVPHLPPGKYTVIIGETELYFTEPGKRVFDITTGDLTLAANFDAFAASGASGKVKYLTNAVEHLDDSLRGPFAWRSKAALKTQNSTRSPCWIPPAPRCWT